MNAALDAAEAAYFAQSVNFGPDTPAVRLAESDAFRAGWKAAVNMIFGR